jgi:hypothetical protein
VQLPEKAARGHEKAFNLAKLAMIQRSQDFSASAHSYLYACRIQWDAVLNQEPGATLEDLRWLLASYASVKAGALSQVDKDYSQSRSYYLAFFALVQEDALADTVALNRMIGNRAVIIPGMPAKTREDWLGRAAFVNELAEKLAAYGMFTGYHNHHLEFQPLDGGETAWDVFFGNTRPEVVMQLDLGNALRGGADIMAILRRYPGRCRTIHLKPYSQAAGAEDPAAGYRPLIGEDDVPWDEVFTFCETLGNTEWYIVEYESDAYPSLEAVARCRQALKKMGK